MKKPPYHLAEDVFLCLSDDRFVFLDLRSDQYFCLDRKNTRTANYLLSERDKHSTAARNFPTENGDSQLVLDALARKGLLVTSDKRGKEITAVAIQPAANPFLNAADNHESSVDLGHWAAFFHASFKASWKLRCYSMQRTVRSVRNRKRRYSGEVSDRGNLRKVVAAYQHLRPFYPRKYRCLYDSLALVEFLAQYHLFPQWVFGVNTEPFGAHCWVQEEDFVLNDSPEFISNFTPIMSI